MSRVNPFEFPGSLIELYREAEQKFYILLQSGQFNEARGSWNKVYEKFLQQQQLKHRFHKGGIFHNIGIIEFLSNKLERSFKYFVLGFVEDVISEEEGFAGKAEGAPGAQNLRNLFGVDDKLFLSIRKFILSHIGDLKIKDPKIILHDFLNSLLQDKTLQNKLRHLKEYPLIVQRYSINIIPGEWNKRVFIGGNYSGNRIKNLLEIKKVVEEKKYTPILALEFKDLETHIHHHSLLLLHNCKFAIFDVSADSGYLMEVERTFDYQTETLFVYEQLPEFRITAMIKSLGKELKLFSGVDQLHRLVKEFLPDFI